MKSVCLLAIILISHIQAFCQTWEDLVDQAIRLKENEEYSKATPIAEKALALAREMFGETHLNYAASLNNLGLIYKDGGQLEKAEPYLVEAFALVKKLLPENDQAYINCADNLADLYVAKGELCKAEPLCAMVRRLLKKAIRPDNSDYLQSVRRLGTLYYRLSEFPKAEELVLEITDSLLASPGPDHPDYAFALYDLAVVRIELGKFKNAEQLCLRVLAILRNHLGEQHLAFAAGFSKLAEIRELLGQNVETTREFEKYAELYERSVGSADQGYAQIAYFTGRAYSYLARFTEAIPLFERALAIHKAQGDTLNLAYAAIAFHLGQALQQVNQFEVAKQLLLLAARIRKLVEGDTAFEYGASLYGLGSLYTDMGEYALAESSFIRARELVKASVGADSRNYGTILQALGVLYIKLGLYDKAEPLLIEAADIDKKSLGETHPSYASALNTIGGLYKEMGYDDEAESLYKKALAIRKASYGENHSDYVESLNNLAGVYFDRGQLESAIALYERAREITNSLFGRQHSDFSMLTNNIALAYKYLGQLERAKSLLHEAMAVDKAIYGDMHPSYATTVGNLAEVQIGLHEYDSAQVLLSGYTGIRKKELIENFSFLSEREKGDYIDNSVSLTTTNNSFIYSSPRVNPGFLIENFELLLLVKSLSLRETKNSLGSLREIRDSATKMLFARWQGGKALLAKQYSLPLEKRNGNLDSLESELNGIEKELYRRSSEFRRDREQFRTSLKDVQQVLADDEACIEFVHFHLFRGDQADSTMYAAYILRKQDTVPLFVPLCEEKQLASFLSKTGNGNGVGALNRSSIIEADNEISPGDSLSRLVWNPLLPYLREIRVINYSPAGLLNLVAFHALPAGDGSLLIEKYRFSRYISTTKLAEKRNAIKPADRSIVLFGNPTFSMDSVAIARSAPVENPFSTVTPVIRGSREDWIDLAGTANEIEEIGLLFKKNKRAVTTYVQGNATEDHLKSLNGNSPAVLHMATHGFFLTGSATRATGVKSSRPANAFSLADDPMLRSGLVLAGANRAWRGEKPIEGHEDGIVTAYEIAQLDLRKTDLVVLSACETALGDIKGTEGVFGLQRAFKLAGVDKMLLSLWKVPDRETAELMRSFYSHYLAGKTAREALFSAQNEMRAKYSPYFWAAFVLIE